MLLLSIAACPRRETIAEHLGVPFTTLSFSPPFYLEADLPPVICGWSRWPRARIDKANAAFCALVSPIMADLNQQRREWGLREFCHPNETFSPLGIVSQLPEDLEFEPARRSLI